MSQEQQVVSVNRRAALGGIAALSAVGAVAGSTPALLQSDDFSVGDTGLRSFHARYALRGGDVLAASFAAPRGKIKIDTVVLMPGKDGFAPDLKAKMRRYARAGKYVVAPDFEATYRNTAIAGYDAMVRDMLDKVRRLSLGSIGNGRLSIVAHG
ncbi:hypothetical protein AB5I39_05755 [Sphingomonas sp. MMS24-J45]|uniref:hypothetical protein n=1 Tax=Sphingomonas sp. MMS24-J45 TaxID=3238806 RepID=UPI00384E4C24